MSSTRSWTGQSRGGRLGNLFFVFLVRSGGLVLAPFFLVWVALYFLFAAPKSRRASTDLARRLKLAPTAIHGLCFAFRHFYTFGILHLDRLAILAGQASAYQFEASAPDAVRAALGPDRGAILLTAHIGNWEAMGLVLADLDVPLRLVMYDGIDEKMRAAVEEMSRGRNFEVIYTDGSPASAAAILQALREGAVVGMMGDRSLSGESASVPFLDGEADFPLSPYVVAVAAGAPIMHVFTVRTGRRSYKVHHHPFKTLSYQNRASRRDDLRGWAAEFAQHLEQTLREQPQQWGNFFPFWNSSQNNHSQDN